MNVGGWRQRLKPTLAHPNKTGAMKQRNAIPYHSFFCRYQETTMKQFVATLLIAISCTTVANAQTFLDRLQRQAKGQGKVTVTQEAAIDELVNGPKTVTNGSLTTTKPTETKSTEEKKSATKPTTKGEHDATAKKTGEGSDTEMDITTIDTRKKVMGKSYKVNGYRVQAYAGGNTRNDRQKAEKIGNDIKFNFPNEPIYVHFYSPRWICRVGNYRTYEEAHKMLLEIRKLGYKQASIVKGKISVQY